MIGTEASKMPRIYRNAYTIIAAAATDSCQGGILVEGAWFPNSKACQVPTYRQRRSGTVTINLPLNYNINNSEMNLRRSRA
jgi:hypothetical protein